MTSILSLGILLNIAAPSSTHRGSDTLTHESLGRLLASTDYEYQKIESGNHRCYRVRVHRDDSDMGTIFVFLMISPNGKKLWSQIYVMTLDDNQTTSAGMMAMLLERNSAISPSHYRIEKEAKMLFMSRCSDTRGLTAELLADHVEAAVEQYVQSEYLELVLYGWTHR